MIALVPDPVRSSATQDYDSKLDGLSRAAEAAGLVLTHFRFPWDDIDKSGKESPDQPGGNSAASGPPANSAPPGVAGAAGAPWSADDDVPWSPRQDDQPGLLVFRKGSRFLAVFLVLETPTRGLRKHQLNWSLDLLDAFADLGTSANKDAGPRSFSILGPSYTGTQNSLNHGIDGWLTRSPSKRLRNSSTVPPLWVRRYRFSIAASATEIDAAALKDLNSVAEVETALRVALRLGPSAYLRPVINFRSASNRRNDVSAKLISFLKREFGCEQVAFLLESNTLLGKRLADGQQSKGPLKTNLQTEVYHYPLHISSLRAVYEKQGVLRDMGGQVFRSAGRLELAPRRMT